MDCPYLKDGSHCSLALHYRKLNQLSISDRILVTEKACLYCKEKASPPQYYNCVTLKLSNNNNQINPDEIDFENECSNKKLEDIIKNDRLEKVLNGDGVGSCMWKILDSIGIKHTANCPCLDWAERMNAWGPDLCNKNRKQIIEHMKLSSKNYGWGDVARAIRKAIENKLIYKLNPLDPFGSLLNEAIRIAIKKEPIDIIIPLGNGSKYNNIEICIALRSIEKNAIGYRRIFIIGKIPEFLIENDVVKLISLNEFNCGKEARISQKFIWAFNNLDTTDRVVLWNDDYVLLQETDIRNIDNYYKGSLLRSNNKGYSKRLNATHDYLIRNKLPTLNYDCHVPIIYEKEKFLSIMNQWNDSKNNGGFTAKSIYGNNFCQNQNKRIKDVKLGKGWSKQFNKILKNKRWLISYGDNALNNGLKEKLLELFPNKSSYEK